MAEQAFLDDLEIAVVIPCLNEAATIGKVVAEVRQALPEAKIYVYDNGSTDNTAEVAKVAGARVRFEPKPGKGRVLRTAFRDIEAQIFVMVDGDDTYDVSILPQMVEQLIEQKLDMVVGDRLQSKAAHQRLGHFLGNRLFSGLISHLFEFEVRDPFSGLRVMTARFVKSFPSVSKGFEVETELTVHAYDLDAAFIEVPVTYRQRPEDSHSKLKTFRDGLKILRKLIWLYQMKKPMPFYGTWALIWLGLSVVTFLIPLVEFLQTGQVSHFPTLIVSVGGFMMSLLLLAIGILAESSNSNSREVKRFLFRSSPHV